MQNDIEKNLKTVDIHKISLSNLINEHEQLSKFNINVIIEKF